MGPSAQRRPFPGVFQKAQRAQPIAKRRVLGVGGDFSDGIHVERSARIAGGLVGYEEARYGASHEHKFVKERAQEPGSRDQLLKI